MNEPLSTAVVVVPPIGGMGLQSFMFPIPLSYEFQVVEYVDVDGKIVKVELQSKINKHDQNGNVINYGAWIPVPRVQLPSSLFKI